MPAAKALSSTNHQLNWYKDFWRWREIQSQGKLSRERKRIYYYCKMVSNAGDVEGMELDLG